jgi:hypothetical protein
MKDKISTALLIIIIILGMIFGIIYGSLQHKFKNIQNDLLISQKSITMYEGELQEVKSNLQTAQQNLQDEICKSDYLTDQLDKANTTITVLENHEYMINLTVTNYEVEIIAKTVYGEARGLSTFEQSMVVWCILNRVDNGTWGKTITSVASNKTQFHGYSKNHPVTSEIKSLVEDVIYRWQIEKLCVGDVGRTLPAKYLYFHAEGGHNIFTTSWTSNGERYDWSNCINPYS